MIDPGAASIKRGANHNGPQPSSQLEGATAAAPRDRSMALALGVIFHLWERLRYQNAIWHVFVLLGAACHFTAVWDLAIA